jgi:hypothetical protein
VSRILWKDSFDRETTKAVDTAFASSCQMLNLTTDDPTTVFVARKIVELARRGERDPRKLCVRVLAALQENPVTQ